MMGLLFLAMFTVAFSMLANRLSTTVLTAPMLFIGFGFLMAETGFMSPGGAEETLHIVAEVALIVLLFLDAAQIDLATLRKRHVWPVRMLVFGLPLSLLLGTAFAYPFLSGWPIFAVALVAAILAPTDAALGQAVISNPDVPERPRRALTVESGLNDGLALPAVLLFASLAAEAMDRSNTDWLIFGAKQILLGPLAGAVAGLVGGTVLLWAKRHMTTSDTFEGVGAIALAGGSYLAATLIDGNGFIAAFVAGLSFGNVVKGRCKFIYEFTESEGQLLTWGAFFLLGLALVPEAVRHLDMSMLAIILLSLFITRPLAIWISLVGTDASPVTRLFFGWFGPRGLATALFALLVVSRIDHVFAEPVLLLAVNAVWISALLHGLSAAPGARWYARKVAGMGECAEMEPVEASAKPLKTQHQET
ncbi:cation:proton antiporter [Hoeflea sp. TYP-13]|uniref:cation:proton antiporter n=1 Tax=Hoeflea sp. TYP-13 TaxID=3230023 RepID=UPI0034C6ACF2